MSMVGLPGLTARCADEADAVVDQRVAGEHEEQQHALEDARDLVGDAERDLRRLAAEIGQRQHQAGGDDAERIEPPEEGDDDRGEAVAGRDRLAAAGRSAPETSEMPASPASAPDSRKAKNTMPAREKPAKRPARGLWPSTLTSKPFSVRSTS